MIRQILNWKMFVTFCKKVSQTSKVFQNFADKYIAEIQSTRT